jgi:hypothetical protein
LKIEVDFGTVPMICYYFFLSFYEINVREYLRGNQKRTIQKKEETQDEEKTKTQHNMCQTPLCGNKHRKRK